MQEISQKARQVLEYLTQRESSIPPTVREIGAALQIKSTSTVHKYLTELAAAGYIEKGDKMNRAISLPQQQSAKDVYKRQERARASGWVMGSMPSAGLPAAICSAFAWQTCIIAAE